MPSSRIRPLVFTALSMGGATLLALAGCFPAYTFGEGGTGGDGSPGDDTRPDATSGADSAPDGTTDAGGDSTTPLDAPNDAPPDSPVVPFDGGIVAVPLVADAGSKVGSTGYGYQLHVVYAENDKAYWFFYVDDTAGEIKTLRSTDFKTWVGGAAVPLSGSYTVGDGYNFSVAYANIAGSDVVHMVIDASGPSFASFHIRAQISGGSLSSATPIALPNATNGGVCTNDGPATTVTPAGRVYDVTAWTDHGVDDTTCDTDVYLASGADLGTSWNAGALDYDGYYVSVQEFAFSHDLVNMPEAGTVMLVFPDHDNVAPENSAEDFASIGWALSTTFHGGAPASDSGVFEDGSFELFTSTNQQASIDDWTACRFTADADIHVIRHVLTSAGNSDFAFEEDIYNGSTWQPTSNPPLSSTSLANTGVVLLSGADSAKGVLLVTLGADGALNVQKWTSAGGWVQTGKLASDGNTRQSLAGSGCGSARPTVFWTETIGSATAIESADLSGFLQ